MTASLDEDGNVIFREPNGEIASARAVALAWEQQREALSAWLTDRAREINGDIERIKGIHVDTPNPSTTAAYEAVPFLELEPQPQAAEPFRQLTPSRPVRPRLGFFARLFPSRRRAHAAMCAVLDERYKDELLSWEQARARHNDHVAALQARYQHEHEEWEKRRAAHQQAELECARNYPERILNDDDFKEAMLERALEDLEWPRETEVRLDIEDRGRLLLLDVDLPEVEDFPNRLAEIGKSGRRLIIKEKTERRLREEYSHHIHGIALRLAGVAFSVLPGVEQVVVSGYSQRVSKATGQMTDEYLFSAIVDRIKFSAMNFSNWAAIDPIEAMAQFQLRRNMTSTGILRPIVPFAAEDAIT